MPRPKKPNAPHPNKLLVEGDDEKRVIPYFMDAHVVWGDKEKDWVVRVESLDGVDELKPGVVEAEFNEDGLRNLGIIVDADDDFGARWAQVRDRCLEVAPDFPPALPREGLIHAVGSDKRIGVWIMPDNGSRGMLETFLGLMRATGSDPLWDFAAESCRDARGHGASYTDAHFDKSRIHSYLAWIEPPGLQMHQAVLRRANIS